MTDPFAEQRNAAAGLSGMGMSADVRPREMRVAGDAGGDALLPCPFCDGEVELKHNTHGREYWETYCPYCDFVAQDRPSRGGAIIAWNTRALNTPTESVKAPEGVTIPREPTQAMMDAGLYNSSDDSEWSDVHTMWKAMFDAVTLDGGSSTHAFAASLITADDAAQDESTITDVDINAAVRHGFGDATADALAVDDAVAKERERAVAIADRVALECEADIGHCFDDVAGQERARGGMIEARRISNLLLARSSETATDVAKPEGGA